VLCFKGTEQYLQGGVKVPTGGKVREREKALIRCDSGTDSRVWMEEDTHMEMRFLFHALSVFSGRYLFVR